MKKIFRTICLAGSAGLVMIGSQAFAEQMKAGDYMTVKSLPDTGKVGDAIFPIIQCSEHYEALPEEACPSAMILAGNLIDKLVNKKWVQYRSKGGYTCRFLRDLPEESDCHGGTLYRQTASYYSCFSKTISLDVSCINGFHVASQYSFEDSKRYYSDPENWSNGFECIADHMDNPCLMKGAMKLDDVVQDPVCCVYFEGCGNGIVEKNLGEECDEGHVYVNRNQITPNYGSKTCTVDCKAKLARAFKPWWWR